MTEFSDRTGSQKNTNLSKNSGNKNKQVMQRGVLMPVAG